jgi:hypothetical protein
MYKLKTLLISSFLFMASISNAQEAGQALSMIFTTTSNKQFVYDARRLSIDQFPPSSVSIHVLLFDKDKVIGNDIWQHNCRTEEYKIGNKAFTSIRTGIVSASFFMNKAFCGIKDNEGHWFLLASRNPPLDPLFMNLDTVKKTTNPVDGVSVLLRPGSINYDPIKINFSSQNTEEIVFDCAIERYFFKQGDTYVEASIKNGDALFAARYNLCRGVFSTLSTLKTPVSTGLTVTPAQGIEEAKKKCVDLGFKNGTEGFGKCVLQLSK